MPVQEGKSKKAARRRPKHTSTDGLRESPDRYQSRAVTRALDVLERFPDEATAYSLKELSQQMRLPESSLFRLLVTLESRGYLRQDADGAYRLTDRVLRGKQFERASLIREKIHPLLLQMARSCNETTSLAYLFGHHIMVLDSIESFHDIRVINRVGRVLPPYASSMGKAITAFQDRATMDRILDAYGVFRRTERTITDHRAIFEEFEKIRRQGHAFDRGEATEGGVCIGVPILGPNKRVEAAVSVSVPDIRIDKAREQQLIQELQQATQKMASLLNDLR
ncbi:MAG TPA: IclR family transcriptional regulator [Pseudacidobacterium sp.]|nr:IclR family transcriptional regulator [Pseudacidobacterium sp.]